MSALNIISYNVNSIRSNDKANPFSLEVQRLNPDIMTIIDTRLNSEAETYLINLLPDYKVISNYTGHQSRGVSIILKKSLNLEILDAEKDNSGNILLIKLRFNMYDFVIGSIYGPNYDNPMFYEELFDKAFGLGCDSIFLLGDFNMTLNFNMDTRRYNEQRNVNATNKMIDLLEDYSMTDIWRKMHSRKRQFTWMVPNSNPPQMARLDYGFATPNISNNIKHSEILEIAWSDHAPIKFSFDYHRVKSSKNYWICPSHLFKRQEYIDLIIDKIKETYGLYLKTPTSDNFLLHCSPEERVEFFNKNIEDIEDCELSIDNSQFFVLLVNALRNASIDYASRIRASEQDVLKKLQKQLSQLADTDLNAESKNRLRLLYKRKIAERTRAAFLERNAKWIREGEKMSPNFFKIGKNPARQNFIPELYLESRPLENGQIILTKNQELIEKEIHTYYSELYKNNERIDNINDNTISDFLQENSDNYKLEDSLADELETPLDISEFDHFMRKVNKGSTPGLSGLSFMFYDKFWKYLRKPVFRMANHSFLRGCLPEFVRQGVLKLIPKGKKDGRYKKNWRPLILQNSSYKILSGVMTNRINKALPHIIKDTQSGFIKGRTMTDNIRIISALLEYSKKAGKKGLLIAIDFQKAFDSISFPYIEKSLKFFGFKDYFCDWVKIFLNRFTVSIQHAGRLLEPFRLFRGSKQGDPLSPALFIIGIEILLIKLRNCQIIKKYYVYDQIVDQASYADDINLAIDYDETSLRRVLTIMNNFELISGLKLQLEKTQVTIFGLNDNEIPVKLCPDLQMVWSPTINFLGVVLDWKFNATDQNYTNKYNEIKAVLRNWEYKYLTVYGRKLIVQTLALPKLANLAMVLPDLSEDKIRQLEKMLLDFVWGSSYRSVAVKDAKCNEIDGGFNLFCVRSQWKGFKVKWLHRAITSPDKIWATILEKDIQTVFPDKHIYDIPCLTFKQIETLSKKLPTIFWRQVFKHYLETIKLFVHEDKTLALSTNFWDNCYFKCNNVKISTARQIITDRIAYPVQIINGYTNNTFTFHSKERLEQIYNIDNIPDNIYFKMTTAVTNFCTTQNIKPDNLPDLEERPFMSLALKLLTLQYKGCSKWVYILKKSKFNKTNIEKRETQCETRYGIRHRQMKWTYLYKLNSSIKYDNTIRWHHYLILRDNLNTNTHSVHYRGGTDLCTFCDRERETTDHLLWRCDIVKDFRQRIADNINNEFSFLNLVPNTPKSRILGYTYRGSDNFEFIFYQYINRFIWLSKHRQGWPNIHHFKNYVNERLAIQKEAGILTCLELLHLDYLWR